MAKKMPDIKEVRLLSRSDNSVRLQQTYQAPYTFGIRVKAIIKMQETSPRILKYKLIESGDIRSLEGTWTIEPHKSGIQLTHKMRIEPIIPEIVIPLYSKLFEKNLHQSMVILKQLMESEIP